MKIGFTQLTGQQLFDLGYRRISNKHRLVNTCMLDDAALIKWAMTSGECDFIAELRDHYRRIMPGRLQLTEEQFDELKAGH